MRIVAGTHTNGELRSDAAEAGEPCAVEVRRSTRRRRTVTAFREDDRIVVCIPARFSRADEKRWVAEMLARLDRQDERRKKRTPASDDELMSRSRRLSDSYLDGRAKPHSVRWVSNQRYRWGSCTPMDGTVRLSDRLRAMPTYVVDYVLVHELAHLLVAGHGQRFWALVDRYPQSQRARGYLEGVEAAVGLERSWDEDSPPSD